MPSGDTRLAYLEMISPVVMWQIAGFGADSYMAALEVVIRRLSEAKA